MSMWDAGSKMAADAENDWSRKRIAELEAACAAKDEALEDWLHIDGPHVSLDEQRRRWGDVTAKMRAALALDCGKALLGELQQLRAEKRVSGWKEGWVPVSQERFQVAKAHNAALEEAAKVAEDLPGLSDDPSSETLDLIRVDPVAAIRSAVAVTKRNSAAAIRALKEGET